MKITYNAVNNQYVKFHNMAERKNTEFYILCTEYFAALRKQGKHDDAFEDEFYYTMPIISDSS